MSLENISVYTIAEKLGRLSGRWLKKDFLYRKRVVQKLIRKSGYTRSMAEGLIDGLFSELTEPKLVLLLKAELRDPLVLDEFCRDPLTGHQHRAHGPKRITHIFAGNIPNPAIISFILGMLVKSVNVGKCSSKDDGFLDIYLDSLKATAPELVKSNKLIAAGDKKALHASIQQSDLVIAYGSGETLAAIQKQVPAGKLFIGYGHRASFSLYTKESLRTEKLETLCQKAAIDLWMADSRGCLSPISFFLEKNSKISSADFAMALLREIKKLDFRGERLLELENKIKIGQIRGSFIREIKSLNEFYKFLSKNRHHLQCIALKSSSVRRKQIAETLSRLGVNRICRAGQMQFPPLTWHHDGQFNLASWLQWADLE